VPGFQSCCSLSNIGTGNSLACLQFGVKRLSGTAKTVEGQGWWCLHPQVSSFV
jgi:hypothetical protein